MLSLSNINLNILHTKKDLEKKVCKLLNISDKELLSYKIKRQSIDARNKQDILYNYTLILELKNEEKILKANKKNINLTKIEEIEYSIKASGNIVLEKRPVIVGFGPAGIFAALSLAIAGFRPIVIEQGEDVDTRTRTVEEFWNNGILKENSNVSFGEGGAGTFSDGKLNTLVKDKTGRNTFVLETLVRHGADENILYNFKPHIGTDKLKEVVKSIRNEIISLGGEVFFNTKMTDIIIENDRLKAIKVNTNKIIDTDIAIFCTGHSARDTFKILRLKNIEMEAKNFAMGLRIIHSQEMIDKSSYGLKYYKELSPANYKLTYTSSSGRGVYSFCMCPGGYVVNSSSSKGELVVNGMSYNNRGSDTANSAIIVTVTKEDFYKESGETDIFAGLKFQEMLEKRAYNIANGKIPIQLYKDFENNKVSVKLGVVSPNIKGEFSFENLNEILPEYITSSIKEAIKEFDKKIKGFADDDAILVGVETRTSSPIKIFRNEEFEANIKGIYPCGEGAGYAGGITSAAMDGLKVAEFINKKYSSLEVSI